MKNDFDNLSTLKEFHFLESAKQAISLNCHDYFIERFLKFVFIPNHKLTRTKIK